MMRTASELNNVVRLDGHSSEDPLYAVPYAEAFSGYPRFWTREEFEAAVSGDRRDGFWFPRQRAAEAAEAAAQQQAARQEAVAQQQAARQEILSAAEAADAAGCRLPDGVYTVPGGTVELRGGRLYSAAGEYLRTYPYADLADLEADCRAFGVGAARDPYYDTAF